MANGIAAAFAGLSQKDSAVAWLDRALAAKSIELGQALIQRMGFP